MKKKKLRLHRETLRRLDPHSLGGVVGAETGRSECYQLSCDSGCMAGCASDQQTECPIQTVNTGATSNCTGEQCTQGNTLCLCPVC